MAAPVYLIDASIYIFQAHFSPQFQSWSKRSEDRSAFAGFARFLLRFLQVTKAEKLAVAFDESLFSGFRHQLYPAYKSNRVLPDDNLARQLKACASLCKVLGVAAYASRNYEADDIIGTLSACVRSEQTPGLVSPVVIVTRDKDLSQLLAREEDYVWDFNAGVRRYRQDIFAHYGIWPEQFPCFLGLTGDSIDCIPGVPGIGPVAARHLLQHFTDLDALFPQLETVSDLGFRGARRCRQLLQEHQQQALLSRQLARIVSCEDVSESFVMQTSDALRVADIDGPGFMALLADMALADGDVQRLQAMLHGLVKAEAA
ncbi:5'-3' exonuclease [Pseudohongiella sp.]|uniref:5'-3' exonuclease domain-containing protein n=1 Tax=marine sediment metagenome TaxID=412755 RepID=A0A0F9WHG5_9ZZZZ|nr:5'-3' exonuclease H3TH domain-containing protein [Pseudohongiella sp.]HDZ08540.1 flap endonuclease [Pseudohongiella sp.]HEA61722.1 flap endonuclease [Pseudohongiella sp.]